MALTDSSAIKHLTMSIRSRKREITEGFYLAAGDWTTARVQAKHIAYARAGLLGKDCSIPYAFISSPGKPTAAEAVITTPLPGAMGTRFLAADNWSANAIRTNSLGTGLAFRFETVEGASTGKHKAIRLFRGVPDGIINSEQYAGLTVEDSPVITINLTPPTLDDTTLTPTQMWPADLAVPTPDVPELIKWNPALDRFLTLLYHYTVYAKPEPLTAGATVQTFTTLAWRAFMYRGVRDKRAGRPTTR